MNKEKPKIPIEFYKIILQNKKDSWDFSQLKDIFYDFENVNDLNIIYFSNNKFELPLEIITKNGSIELFKAICSMDTHKKNGYICEISAKYGRLDCLECAHEMGFSWDEYTCYCATIKDNIECLEYAHKHGCPWDKNTLFGAVMNQSRRCIQYAYENDCPLGDELYDFIDSSGKYNFHGQIQRSSCNICANYGNLCTIQYIPRKGYKWYTNICDIACQYGHFHCLQFAHENGYPWSMNTTYIANKYKNVTCLKYAIEEGCPCSIDILKEIGYI